MRKKTKKNKLKPPEDRRIDRANAYIGVRCTKIQRMRYLRKASRANLSITDWVLVQLDQAVERR